MILRLLLFVAASSIFFAAERFGQASMKGFVLCLALWAASLLLEYRELRLATLQEKAYRRSILGYRCTFLSGVVLYLLSQALRNASISASTVLAVLSLALIGTGLIWGVSLEALPHRGLSSRSPYEVSGRNRSSLSMAFLLITLVSLNYIAARKDKKIDTSFLKVTAAGEATRKTVARLAEPVRVGIFFSRDSEVLPLVRDYFESFDPTKLKLEFYDKDFNPTQAQEFRVARNGQIVVLQDEKRQRFELGDTIEEARRNLRTMDASFLKAVLQLTSLPATLYFTSTHGEMLWETGSPAVSMSVFEELLRGLNFRTRRLTSLFQDVPSDAKILGIIGPTASFTREEIETIHRYLQRGGRLLLALDIDEADDAKTLRTQDELPKFLASIGLRYSRAAVANDRRFVAVTREKSDRTFLFTNVFANHPAVATAALSPERMTFMSHRSGSFDLDPQSSAAWSLTAIVKSLAGSFRDDNRNFEADLGEQRGSFPIVVAAQTPDNGRIVAYGDATGLSDPLMKVPANQLVALDSIRWLADRTEEAGAVANEEDVLIRQEKSRETLVFYSSIFAMPLLVLCAGAWATRRRTKPAAED
jgi:hypothetical protein